MSGIGNDNVITEQEIVAQQLEDAILQVAEAAKEVRDNATYSPTPNKNFYYVDFDVMSNLVLAVDNWSQIGQKFLDIVIKGRQE